MMKKYEDATWNDLATYGEVSPVAGLDAVTSKQLSELLGVPMEVVSKHKSRYDKELRSLGMFTAAPKKLADRLHVLERTPGNGFAVELEGGGRLELYCGNTVYFTAPAACRLADVVSGVNDEKKESGRRGRTPSKEPAKKPISVLALQEVQRAAVEHERVEGLVPVTIRDDQPSVSARDLYEFLEVGAQFSHWFDRMCEYGFTEGLDYQPFLANRSDGLPGKPRQDAALSIDMAKEICMLQRNEKGKIARQYFSRLEKDWNYHVDAGFTAPLASMDRKIAASGRSDIMSIQGIECYERDGTAYLKLETVARGLGFTETAASGNECVRWRTVRKYLADFGIATSCDDGKLPDFIPENIFYRLAMKAKNEAAEKFQAKIADEVIPSVRKHGMYITPQTLEEMLTDPDTAIRMLQAIKNERNQRRDAERKVLELDAENKALAREQLTWDYRSILVRLVRMYGAKVFDDYKKGWRAFFRELRYKEGISLNNRAGDGPFIDRLVGDEWVKAVAVAASMCKEQYISMSWAVNEVNLDLVNRC